MQVCPSCNNLNPGDVAACLRCRYAFDVAAQAPQAAYPPAAAAYAPPVSAPAHGAPAATFDVGTVAGGGRYQIVKPLGAGAMGAVYEATDLRLSRQVALKVLSGALLSHPTARERMAREARALARVEHRNVVQIRDVFDEGPSLVLVLELVTGGDLARRARSAALSPGEVLSLMEGVLLGLEAIHEVGIVHRDIKPGNILLTENGTPKLTDLGVAHDSRGRSMTGMGAQLGTAEYMSPEQVRGQAVDVRTDVYAAGVMLYELLAQRVPFLGESDFDICHAQVHHAPDLSPLESAGAPHLVEVCRRALEKEPNDRWQTAQQMRQALRDESLELSVVRLPESPPPIPTNTSTQTFPTSPTPTDEVAIEVPPGWLNGREGRAGYFGWGLLQFMLWAVVVVIVENGDEETAGIMFVVAMLPLLCWTFVLVVRRLHDTDHSGWWILCSFIPFINWFLALYLLFAPSHPEPNQWGPKPG